MKSITPSGSIPQQVTALEVRVGPNRVEEIYQAARAELGREIGALDKLRVLNVEIGRLGAIEIVSGFGVPISNATGTTDAINPPMSRTEALAQLDAIPATDGQPGGTARQARVRAEFIAKHRDLLYGSASPSKASDSVTDEQLLAQYNSLNGKARGEFYAANKDRLLQIRVPSVL